MSRGKKLVALATGTSNLLDESDIVGPNSNYDPNKKIHVLEDITFQCLDSRDNILETSNGNHIYLKINDDVTVTGQTDLSLSRPNTTFDDVISNHFYSITDENLIVVPSQYEIESPTNILTSDCINYSEIHSIQTFDISPEPIINPHQVISNTPDEIRNILISDSPIQSISQVETTHHIVPNPPISDDSDTEKKLVPYSDSDSDSLVHINKSKKRKKRIEVNKEEWFSEQNKRKREKGKKYYGREKKQEGWNYSKPKEARFIKPRCSCKIGKYTTFKCETVDENVRNYIFNSFWNLTWGEKKTLINEWVTTIPTARPRNRKIEGTTKRGKTFVYHLKVNDERVKVCRRMFLNTLDLGRWTVQNWKQEYSMRPPSIQRRSTQSSETVSEEKQSLLCFLDSLPVMESHYCRATTQKLYLLPEWQSKESLYQFYVNNWCKERNIKALSITLFSNLFAKKNYALFRPKKDQCEKCACHKVGTITREEYIEHITKTKDAREEKDADKKRENYVFTVDLQAVLMAPKSNISTLYYKTKLQVHNLCFFNLKNKDGFCFIWNEVEGGLNAEKFASIWIDFLENKIIPDIDAQDENKTIIIYSDGCTYQNRNCILSNALLNIVMRHNNIAIEQKFLEVGHTQMEADSMHSTIERYLKNKVINVPAEYVSIAKHARKCPAPYIVKYLNHSYFKKIDKIQFYKSIRPGRTKGDLKVTGIRALRYESNGSILYKVSFKDEWQPLPQRRSLKINPCEITDLTQLHHNRRKITARKFEDLQQIKKTLPCDYHKYYDDLPHE